MSRPIQPTYRRQFAEFLGLLDPRCDSPRHNTISEGVTCPGCGRDLSVYLRAVPLDWPE